MNSNQEGNVLVASLLILVTMNLMGAGLIKTSVRESTLANYKVIDSQVFHITDSCTHDVITFFKTQTTTPSSVSDITVSDLSYMYTGNETTTQQNKLEGFGYSCVTTFITSKSVSSGTGVGNEVSSTGSEYGGSGGELLKDFYQIVATGTGPNNAQKTINTIISVRY